MDGELWVYKFKFTYYDEKGQLHHHSGLIIAYNTKDAFNKLYDNYFEENEHLDFDSFEIKPYSEYIQDAKIILDEEDEWYA